MRRWSPLDSCLALLLVLHWVVLSSWDNGWGGTVYGPRLFAKLIPVFLYFLLPTFPGTDAHRAPQAPCRGDLRVPPHGPRNPR